MIKTVKVIVSGDGGVGKTSFLNRLVYDNFDENSELTRGIDFYSKSFHVNGIEYNFVMWDFAGQSQFKEILDEFVDGSIAAFILFDLTRIKTLENVAEWMMKLKQMGNIPILLVGTKTDLINSFEIHSLDNYISQLIELNENVINFVKISSKTGDNVKKAFELLIEKIS
ncbi:MAG: Rab family GTPase [Candidatus Hodarchaeota archaeon]